RGSFVTTTGTTALAALALARIRPDHVLLPQTVRWLVVARAADGWHTSVDRALGVLALTSYAVSTGELAGDYSYKVLLDDKDVLAGLVTPGAAATSTTKSVPLTTLTPGKTNLLAITREYQKPGRLYYTLDLRYVTPAKEVEAVNRGFAISHQYTLIDDPAMPAAARPQATSRRGSGGTTAPGSTWSCATIARCSTRRASLRASMNTSTTRAQPHPATSSWRLRTPRRPTPRRSSGGATARGSS